MDYWNGDTYNFCPKIPVSEPTKADLQPPRKEFLMDPYLPLIEFPELVEEPVKSSIESELFSQGFTA